MCACVCVLARERVACVRARACDVVCVVRVCVCVCGLQVSSGQVQLALGVDEIYTLTTVTTGQRGDHGQPPASAPFPIDYFAFFSSKRRSQPSCGLSRTTIYPDQSVYNVSTCTVNSREQLSVQTQAFDLLINDAVTLAIGHAISELFFTEREAVLWHNPEMHVLV